MKIKKLSSKITFMVGAIILIVAGSVAFYMQTRIITEIGRHTELNLQYKSKETAEKLNFAFFEADLNNIEISVQYIEDLIKDFKIYNSGFALLKSANGEIYETNDFVKRLSAADKNNLINSAASGLNKVFEIKSGSTDYLCSSSQLFNDYILITLAPKSEVNAEIYASVFRFIIIFIVAYSIVLVIANIIGKKMGKPIGTLSAFMHRAGSTGNITAKPEEQNILNHYMANQDEIGIMIKNCNTFIDHVTHIAEELQDVACGDLTIKLEVLSDEDTLGQSIKDVVASLNQMFREIQNSSNQVSSGSSQVADGAQSLASSSTQQAAALQELAASVADIAEKTMKNTERTSSASSLANAIMQNAEKGNQHMDEMIKAVGQINESSQNISKVIKVIDDIAFQTNILALNAAVEAARAGQHGKGFAVVAEEVRNLASKSAEAAKNTAGMIEDSMNKAELGTRIAGETAESLNKIVSGISESNQILSEIARSTEEQNFEISQINTAISDVTLIVQQNSATAEQSAAASEEMNSQGAILDDLISKFKLLN